MFAPVRCYFGIPPIRRNIYLLKQNKFCTKIFLVFILRLMTHSAEYIQTKYIKALDFFRIFCKIFMWTHYKRPNHIWRDRLYVDTLIIYIKALIGDRTYVAWRRSLWEQFNYQLDIRESGFEIESNSITK